MSVFDPPEHPDYRMETVFSDWGGFYDRHSAQDGGRVSIYILYEDPDADRTEHRWRTTRPVVGLPRWWP